ncbi:hypothetical protein SNE35_28735 [Paucibacter sp. R3-3]|uniref:Integrase n=1 Tax=Roseateles agri TaxID=3098619 RepID=A0ABU5DQB6_9BURK|nr:hypothetical protein [Paucibacter sp. R3-3]MDY0748521.1 hypothetical protein [Paucibacter sp. R3-3]
MRPVGEIRQALTRKMRELGKPVTARVLAALACVGFEATRRTLGNLIRDGLVRKSPKSARVPGVKRPVPLYELRMPEQLPLFAEALA